MYRQDMEYGLCGSYTTCLFRSQKVYRNLAHISFSRNLEERDLIVIAVEILYPHRI